MKSNEGLNGTLEETKYFLKGALKNLKEVGTLFPTSKWIARAMCDPLLEAVGRGLKPAVIEAGTGSATRILVSNIERLSRLVICECNQFYCEYLKALCEKILKRRIDQVRQLEIYQGYIQDYTSENQFDFIVCAVPFLCLDTLTNLQIMRKIKELSHSNTIMSLIEHLGSRPIRLAMNRDRRDFYRIVRKAQLDSKIIFKNYFPMKVIYLKPFLLEI
ncbi:MAG: hypothetical protein NZO16_01210 [Deltaproteobacteria bacterium]|nr:hypothetical protein [Deltaproteobacteria bacterium]